MSLLKSDGPSSPDDRLRDIVDFLNDGDTSEALARLRPLLDSGTASIDARFVLAMTAWQLEQFDWTLSLLRECHEEAPDNGGIADALASLLGQLGRLEESLFTAKLATAVGIDPSFAALIPKDYPPFDRAFLSIVETPLLGKARKAYAEGKLGKAIEFARQHTVIEPDHVAGRAFYAECLMRIGAAGAAVESLSILDQDTTAPADFCCLYARALTATGEAAAASHWYRQASDAAPNDAAVATARIADAPFLGDNIAAVEHLAQDWTGRFSLPAKSTRKYVVGGKQVIGYLVSAFADAEDAAAVAAVAQAHDRTRVVVFGYGLGGQMAEQNALLTGAFTKWRDITDLDPATLARTIAGDGIDVVVDAGGFASSRQLQALSRCETALRVSWLGNHTGLVAPLYDTRLAASDYPILAPRNGRASRPQGPIAFGADCGLAQLDAQTVALWATVLVGLPDATLVLRGRDMGHGANVARLIARFGETLATRIDLRQAAQPSEFYSAVDIALMPARGMSPRAAAEALAHGVPALALEGTPYGAFLAGIGLAKTHVATNAVHYQSLAVHMAGSAAARCVPPVELGPVKLARSIEELASSFNSREHAA